MPTSASINARLLASVSVHYVWVYVLEYCTSDTCAVVATVMALLRRFVRAQNQAVSNGHCGALNVGYCHSDHPGCNVWL